MTMTFRIRRSSDVSDKPDTVRFEIEHVVRDRRRVFIVVDLSDSTQGITTRLESLGYLWRLLPAQWPVSLCAMSPSLELPIEQATTSAGDIDRAFEQLRGLCLANSKKLPRLAARGSQLGPALAAIARRLLDGTAGLAETTLPAIIFVLTDGELLDLRPAMPPLDAEVIGIRLDMGNKRSVRWNAVVPGTRLFETGDTELTEHVKRMGSPDAGTCTITVSLTPGETPETYRWDFATQGKYKLDLPRGSHLSTEAFIECRSPNGVAIKQPVHSLLQGAVDDLLSGVPHARPSRVASGEWHEIEDDSLIHTALAHATARHDEQDSWGADIVASLATYLCVSGGDHSDGETPPDALVAVFCGRESGRRGNSAEAAPEGTPRLLLGPLYKDRSRGLCIPASAEVPTDPGFSGRHDVTIVWDNENKRFVVIARDKPLRELRVNESEVLDYFVDVNGHECRAFYSGIIAWPST